MSEFEDQYGDDDTTDELAARSLLDQLLSDSKLYRKSQSYLELLDFAAKIRNVAPFNAMLLELQKPGLTFAASAYDWQQRFGRTIKTGARPLLILWAFGPVATVYDVLDTESKPLPEDVSCFVACGPIDAARIKSFEQRLLRPNPRLAIRTLTTLRLPITPQQFAPPRIKRRLRNDLALTKPPHRQPAGRLSAKGYSEH